MPVDASKLVRGLEGSQTDRTGWGRLVGTHWYPNSFPSLNPLILFSYGLVPAIELGQVQVDPVAWPGPTNVPLLAGFRGIPLMQLHLCRGLSRIGLPSTSLTDSGITYILINIWPFLSHHLHATVLCQLLKQSSRTTVLQSIQYYRILNHKRYTLFIECTCFQGVRTPTHVWFFEPMRRWEGSHTYDRSVRLGMNYLGLNCCSCG